MVDPGLKAGHEAMTYGKPPDEQLAAQDASINSESSTIWL